MAEQPTCELCGDPMPPGEDMFKFHGYSGPCPKPIKPLSTKHDEVTRQRDELLAVLKLVVASGHPHPVENPHMAVAWEAARMAIAKAEDK